MVSVASPPVRIPRQLAPTVVLYYYYATTLLLVSLSGRDPFFFFISFAATSRRLSGSARGLDFDPPP